MGYEEKEMLKRLTVRPLENVGLAQQCLHMAFAACENLGLDFEHTSPNDIKEAIEDLLDVPRWNVAR